MLNTDGGSWVDRVYTVDTVDGVKIFGWRRNLIDQEVWKLCIGVLGPENQNLQNVYTLSTMSTVWAVAEGRCELLSKLTRAGVP